MSSVTHDQQQQLSAIKEAREARLNELILQEARKGYNTPPEVRTEIKQLRADLGLANAVGQEDVSEEMLQLLGRFAQRRATDTVVLELQIDVRDMSRSLRRLWYAYIGLIFVLALAAARLL